jgi:alkanesulfonate monooxygenase SsuD/methylene tetrahydromethanopterin reductase-like flavin-dependent oxidoreductase (luciferase family)
VTPGPAGDPFGAGGFRSSLTAASDRPLPIWLAALGDRMMSLAGRVADGVLLNWCPPERVVSARRTLADAAEAAGRDPADVTVAVYVRACLGVEDEHALPPLQAMTGMYASIPHYRRQMEAVGLGDGARAAATAFVSGRPSDVPVELVRALTVTGGRDGALARFDAYRQAGADLVLVYPIAALDPFSSVLGTVMTAAPKTAIEG